ncbi:MAG: hypothetical protein PHX27_04330 [Candidatus ainarchaeum sp.]|nr:hypothetical protein [Candidatus ainarchaeum sp.]
MSKKIIVFSVFCIFLFLIFGCITNNVVNVPYVKECNTQKQSYEVGCFVGDLSKDTMLGPGLVSSIKKCANSTNEIIYKLSYGGTNMADIPHRYFDENNVFVTMCGGGPTICDFAERIGDVNKCNTYCKSLPENQNIVNECLNSCANCLPKKRTACDNICENFPDCCY